MTQRFKSWTSQKELTEDEAKKIAQQNREILEQNRDIIITETIETIDFDKDGNKITKYEKKKHNISKSINETAKLLKVENLKKLQELIGLSEIK